MTDSSESQQNDLAPNGLQSRAIIRGTGVTEAERYLQRLCERSFLTLWSYPGVFRDQGRGVTGEGKEIADLLVVFEDHIIIFSDKDIQFPNTGRLDVDWKRWYRRAIEAGAKQVWGAERWLREFPTRVFVDRACTQPFPYPLPDAARAKFHRIVVAHGAAERCKEALGGSGSLMLIPLLGSGANIPFAVGDIEPQKGFVHILDDTSLDAVMKNRDTIMDFVEYLTAKEEFVRSGKLLSAAGEEDLLAFYLKRIGPDEKHAFIFPPQADAILIGEGEYTGYLDDPQRSRKLQADEISYAWDTLIEQFAGNVLRGTLHKPSTPGIENHEQGLRLLAREPRIRRRALASALVGLLEQTQCKFSGLRVAAGTRPDDTHYVFLAISPPEGKSYEEYRAGRRQLLIEYSRVVRLKYPDAKTIVGIAREPFGLSPISEDLTVYDGTNFDDEERKAAESAQDLGLLRNVRTFAWSEKEYPDPHPNLGRPMYGPQPFQSDGKIGRNEPCPCGSGKKYKKCHGS